MRERLRAVTVLAAGAVLLVAATLPATAQDQPGVLRVEGALSIVGGEGTVLLVDGDTRYLDTLELRADGMLVNDLSMEAYVAGVAEMPARWPSAALEAQAIAARTYAWFSVRQDAFDGYDICATVACQVFRGAEQVLDGGARWGAAVAATAGQVLTDDAGAPILARYFSTSGGRTYANEDVFPATGARPYLVAIDDPYDDASPYHRWTVRLTRAELDAIVARGDTLGRVGPVAAIERLGDVDDQNARLRVTGVDGTTVEVGAVDFRSFVSRVAPEAFPDRFPTVRADGLRPLPSTLPSSRFTVELTDDTATFHGRGWGHGVGMGQYGAAGRAAEGHDAHQILAAYYGGLAPTTSDALPERIRVGLRRVQTVTVRGDAAVQVQADGDVVVPRALGTWTFTHDGEAWDLAPPPGTDAPLEVAPTRLAGPLPQRGGRSVTVATEVSKPVELTLEVHRVADGGLVLERSLGVADPGAHDAVWLLDPDGTVTEAGDYEVALVATDADGARAGSPVVVTVADAGGILGDALGVGGAVRRAVLVAAVALPVALLLLVLLVRRARP